MSEEQKTSKLGFLEIAAIIIFLVAIVLIFVSQSKVSDRDREIENALRYQHVSELANSLWQASFRSTEFERIVSEQNFGSSCKDELVDVSLFENVLVPEYFEALPQDPAKDKMYHVFVDGEGRITVCASGFEVDGSLKYISITR